MARERQHADPRLRALEELRVKGRDESWDVVWGGSMTVQGHHKPIPDPASQETDADDTSIVPSLTDDPVEEEKKRAEGFGANRPDLA